MTRRLALFRGADPGLLGDAVGAAVDDALGGSERSEVLDDYRGEDYQPGDVAMSCGTVSIRRRPRPSWTTGARRARSGPSTTCSTSGESATPSSTPSVTW